MREGERQSAPALQQLGLVHAVKRVVRQARLGLRQQRMHQGGRQRAVDDHGVQVQKRGGAGHRHGQGAGALGQPGRGVAGQRGAHDGVVLQQQGVVAIGQQGLFELPARGALQQLGGSAFARQAHGQGADGAGIAALAPHDVPGQHQRAADKSAYKDIQKTAQRLAVALQQLGHAGGRSVFGKGHRQGRKRLHLRLQVHLLPARQRLGCLAAQHLGPLVQKQGCGQADADHARPMRAQRSLEVGQALRDGGQHLGRVGVCVAGVDALHHLAAKVRHHDLQAAPPDLDADAERALRMERQRHRGLADLAAHPVLLAQQTVLEQAPHDDGHGLARQVRDARQLGLGQGAVVAHCLKHDALVELAHAHMVGAAHAARIGAAAGLCGCRCGAGGGGVVGQH